MNRILLDVIPYMEHGWKWNIFADNTVWTYRTSESGRGVLMYSAAPDWLYEKQDFSMYGYSLGKAVQTIKKLFDPLDLCMFWSRWDKATLQHLLWIYEEMKGCPRVDLCWGKPVTGFSAKNCWYFKVWGDYAFTILGNNLPEACDWVRSQISYMAWKLHGVTDDPLPFSEPPSQSRE